MFFKTRKINSQIGSECFYCLSIEPDGRTKDVLLSQVEALSTLVGREHTDMFGSPGIRLLGLPLVQSDRNKFLEVLKKELAHSGPLKVEVGSKYLDQQRGVIGLTCDINPQFARVFGQLSSSLRNSLPDGINYLKRSYNFHVVLLRNLSPGLFDFLNQGFNWTRPLEFTVNELVVSRQLEAGVLKPWKKIRLV